MKAIHSLILLIALILIPSHIAPAAIPADQFYLVENLTTRVEGFRFYKNGSYCKDVMIGNDVFAVDLRSNVRIARSPITGSLAGSYGFKLCDLEPG